MIKQTLGKSKQQQMLVVKFKGKISKGELNMKCFDNQISPPVWHHIEYHIHRTEMKGKGLCFSL